MVSTNANGIKCFNLHRLHKDINQAARPKRSLVESDPPQELHPTKLARRSSESNESKGILTSTPPTRDVLAELVHEIKQINVHLECIRADVALHGEVLGRISMDRSCRVCRAEEEHGHEVESSWSDMEESQDPTARPSYY